MKIRRSEFLLIPPEKTLRKIVAIVVVQELDTDQEFRCFVRSADQTLMPNGCDCRIVVVTDEDTYVFALERRFSRKTNALDAEVTSHSPSSLADGREFLIKRLYLNVSDSSMPFEFSSTVTICFVA